MKRLGAALVAILAGTATSFVLPTPWSLVSFAGSAIAGLTILIRKPRKVILRLGALTWTQEELCRHFLITGDTGSGKTTSGFHPILVQLTQNIPNWGGLVLGVKGDEHEFIQELAEAHGRAHDLIHLQVRPPDASSNWKPPHRYNLLTARTIPWLSLIHI